MDDGSEVSGFLAHANGAITESLYGQVIQPLKVPVVQPMAEVKATAITAEVMTLESVAPPGFENPSIPVVPEQGRQSLIHEAYSRKGDPAEAARRAAYLESRGVDLVDRDSQGTDAGPRQLDKLTLAGLAGVVIGSIGPWATVLWVTLNGTAGDGKLTLAAAIVAIIVIVATRRRRIGMTAELVGVGVGLFATALGVYDIVRFSGRPAISVGWGLYLLAIAGVVTIVGSTRHALER
jgi:hypothetical protein